MKFTVDNRFFDKFQKEREKALALWKDLKSGKHKVFIPSTVLAEFFSTIYVKMDPERRDEIERILKFPRIEKAYFSKKEELPISVNKFMPSLLLVDTNPKVSTQAGRLKDWYNLPLGDSYIVASHLLNEGSEFILSDDDDIQKVGKARDDVRVKSLDQI